VTPFADAAWEEVFSSPVVGCFGPLILLAPSSNYNVDFLTISKENLKRFTIPLSFDIAQTAVVHGLAGWFDLHFLPPPSAMPSASEMDQTMEAMMNNSATAVPELEMNFAGTSAATTTTLSSDATIDLGLGSDPSQLDPTISSTYMTTSPYATPTHWQQVRFLFQEPLAINKGQKIVGEMLCEVNEFRSYTLTATVKIDGSSDELLTRRCYWRLDRQVYSWTSASPSTQ
jgi:histone-arginine methyltransferase CARM1